MKRISLVTGGSAGLGFCIADILCKKGESVCIIGRDEEALKVAAAKLNETSINESSVFYFSGSVADETFIKKVFQSIADLGYTLGTVYNCAGVGKFGIPENNNKEMIDATFEACLIGLILVSSHALATMKAHGGKIVNVLSTAALKGNPNESIYCAAKWGARGFTEALKAATKGTNVNVMSVCPGGMNTGFWKEDCGLTPNVSKFMNPYEVAEQIVFAAQQKETLQISELVIDRK